MHFAAVARDVSDNPRTEEIERLFLEHSRFVYGTAYRVTGSAQDAEDIVQTLFLGLLKRGVPPGLRQNPKGYLHQSAVNASLNVLRVRQRRAAGLDAVAEQPLTNPRADDKGSDHLHELQERLTSAIRELPPRAVELLTLRYEHGCTESEIARLLQMSRAAVAVSLFRARRRLQRLVRASSGERP